MGSYAQMAAASCPPEGEPPAAKPAQPPPARTPSRLARQWASPLALGGCIVALLVFSATHSSDIVRWAMGALESLRAMGAYSPLAVLLVQVCVMLLVMPTWPLWLCASAAFDLLWGQVYGLAIAFTTLGAGVWLGSVLAFLLGRYAFRPFIAEWISRRPSLRAIDLAVEQRGLQLGLLLKLSPVMHTALANYILAATRMRLLHFALSCPGTFLSMSVWIFAGASLSSIASLEGSAGVHAALSPEMRLVMVRTARGRRGQGQLTDSSLRHPFSPMR
jgi:uncharacterized membrane protein YdjX (TVP38/TMEM64 family)